MILNRVLLKYYYEAGEPVLSWVEYIFLALVSNSLKITFFPFVFGIGVGLMGSVSNL